MPSLENSTDKTSLSWAAQALDRAISSGKLANSILLQGACLEALEELAFSVACRLLETRAVFQHPDFLGLRPINKMRQISVDATRAMLRFVAHSPQQAACKVVILYEADRMHKSAANAFLKTLEEPPSDSFLILLTTRPYELLPTIRSRCFTVKIHESPKLIEVDAWKEWKCQYTDWLNVLLQSDGGLKDRATCILRLYTLLKTFEEIVPQLAQGFETSQQSFLSEEEALAQEAGRERKIERLLLQDLLVETRKTLLEIGTSLNHDRISQLSKAVAYLDELQELREANLGQIVLLEAFLLQLITIIL
jgi:DNA polymerase-3 subunit delta'